MKSSAKVVMARHVSTTARGVFSATMATSTLERPEKKILKMTARPSSAKEKTQFARMSSAALEVARYIIAG